VISSNEEIQDDRGVFKNEENEYLSFRLTDMAFLSSCIWPSRGTREALGCCDEHGPQAKEV